MKKNMGLIAGILLIILVAGGFAWQFTSRLKVEAIDVKKEAVQMYFIEDGTIALTDYYYIYAPVTAEVLDVYVKQDELVAAGVKIAQLDTTDFERQIQVHQNNIVAYRSQMDDILKGERNTKDDFSVQLEQLYAKRSQIEAEMKVADTSGIGQILPVETLEILQADIEQREKEVDYYEDLYQNQKVLYEAGGLPKLDLEETKLLMEKAQTELSQLRKQESASLQELDRLQNKYGREDNINTINTQGRTAQYQAMLDEVDAQIENVKENMKKDYAGDMVGYYEALIQNEETAITALQDKIKDCSIVADRTGIIYDLPVQNVTMAYEQNILCVVKPENTYMVESFVATDDVLTLQTGDKVELVQKTRTQDIVYTAEIAYIAGWAEETISALGLIEQRVKILIQPLEEIYSAGEGYGLDVKYFYYENNQGIVVPKSALFEFEDKQYVFTIQNGVACKTEVVTGPSSTVNTAVLKGLSPEDVVIKYSSLVDLTDGRKVKRI